MLPKNLCSSCYNCLISFYDYKKLAENVDLQLHQYYDNIVSKPKDNFSDISIKEEDISDSNEFPEFELEDIIEDSDASENCPLSNILGSSLECNLKTGKVLKPKRSKISFKCMQCPKSFNERLKFEKHLEIHESDNASGPVQCEVCSSTFRSTNSLAAHMRIHVPKGRVLSCQYCGKVFKKLSHLKRHEGSHLINKTHKCPKCPKAYHLESALADHMLKHNGIKPHACPICPKSFTHLSILSNHIRLHTRGKAHLCPTCGKRFDSSTNLKQHVLRHAGIKQFACSYCPGKYISKGEPFLY